METELAVNEPQVKMRGKLFLYRQKAPFVPSGQSVYGALEYDAVRDKLKCHECGLWWDSIGKHSSSAHGISAREYKLKHGLRLSSSLISSRVKNRRQAIYGANRMHMRSDWASAGKMRAAGNSFHRSEPLHELRNERGRCPAQILADLKDLGDRLGRAPNARELLANGLHLASALHLFNVKSVDDMLALAGMRKMRKQSKGDKRDEYGEDLLIEILRNFFVAKQRLPFTSEYMDGTMPSQAEYRRVFGSMEYAYVRAGLALVAERRRSPADDINEFVGNRKSA